MFPPSNFPRRQFAGGFLGGGWNYFMGSELHRKWIRGGSMTQQHTVDVCGRHYAVQVYQFADTVWIADGVFLGHQLRTRGSSAKKAVSAWQNAALRQVPHMSANLGV